MIYSVFWTFIWLVLQQKLALDVFASSSIEDSRIHFPGAEQYVISDDDLDPACRGLSFCTVKPHNYPDKLISDMFKNQNFSPPPLPLPEPVTEIDINNRLGDPDNQDSCRIKVTYRELWTVMDKDRVHRAVVQMPNMGYEQKVRMVTCEDAGASCFKILGRVAAYETFCLQEYNEWKFVVAGSENKPEYATVNLPVCCSCHFRRESIKNRFGIPETTPAPLKASASPMTP